MINYNKVLEGEVNPIREAGLCAVKLLGEALEPFLLVSDSHPIMREGIQDYSCRCWRNQVSVRRIYDGGRTGRLAPKIWWHDSVLDLRIGFPTTAQQSLVSTCR